MINSIGKIPISRKVKQLAVEIGVRTIRFKYFNCIVRSFDIWAVVTLFQAPELKVTTGMNIILCRDISVLFVLFCLYVYNHGDKKK